MTEVFHVEFDSRFSEFAQDQSRKERGDKLRAGIAKQRRLLKSSAAGEKTGARIANSIFGQLRRRPFALA